MNLTAAAQAEPMRAPADIELSSSADFASTTLDKATLHGPRAKLSSLLRLSTDAIKTKRGPAGVDHPGVTVRGARFRADGRVQVYVRTRAGDSAAEHTARVAEEIAEGCGEVEFIDSDRGIVQAWLEPGRIERIAALKYVTAINLPGYPIAQTGTHRSQGDALMNVEAARVHLGADGSGIVVGVISDGVSSLAEATASGDLPAPPLLNVLQAGSGDEGTAMLEIVHDLAPGAGLAFYGPGTSLDMAAAIRALAQAGARVIVDDLVFLDEPVFEDGLIAGAVADALADGVSYHSSAGNQARGHYEGDYVAANVTLADVGSIEAHDFGAGDTDVDILIAPFGTTFIILQWDDRWGASANDYDLLIFDESLTDLLGSSADLQTGSEDSREGLVLTNNGADPLIVKALVQRFAGEVRRLEIHTFVSGRIVDHNVSRGALFGHAAVPGAMAVAAINSGDDGLDDLAVYSSPGPSELRFPTTQIRQKPDIAAIDGVTVSGAGGFPSPFFGTSAAAPHTAAIAALLLEAGAADGARVYQCLTASALDRGASGDDFSFGAGLADGLFAADVCFRSVACGDANEDEKNSATDAFLGLVTAVGSGSCAQCVCDVNRDGAVLATDALLMLQFGVGQSLKLACPVCP